MANEYVSKVVLSNGTVLMDLTGDTITVNDLLAGVTAHDKSGTPITGACTYDSDTSDDTVAVSEILIGKTAHARGALLTGTMANNGAVAGKITSKNAYVIPQGYHDGSGTVSLDNTSADLLIARNIREGISILGVTGTMSGSEDMTAEAVSITPTWSAQTITPSTGYNCISQVSVAAIPIVYSDNSAGGQTCTIG